MRQRISHISRLLLVVCAVLVCQGVVAQLQNPGPGLGAGSVPHPLSELPIPPGAYDVQESSAVAGQLNSISFKLGREYPSKTVLDLYNQHFQSADWVKCQGSSDDWHSFFDSTVRPSRRVHRLFWSWVDKDRNKLAQVGIRYYSPDDRSYDKKPAGKTQHVIIVIDQTPDLERRLRERNLNCPREKIP